MVGEMCIECWTKPLVFGEVKIHVSPESDRIH